MKDMVVVSLAFKDDHVALGEQFQSTIDEYAPQGYWLHSWTISTEAKWVTLVALFQRKRQEDPLHLEIADLLDQARVRLLREPGTEAIVKDLSVMIQRLE